MIRKSRCRNNDSSIFLETYFALPQSLYIAFEVFSWSVWAILTIELALKWYAVNGITTKQFLKENAVDLIILILPLIRTLKFVKILKLSKLVQHLESVITLKDAKNNWPAKIIRCLNRNCLIPLSRGFFIG